VRLFHLDLYRLETEEQVAVLGSMRWRDIRLAGAVEWGERFESIVKRRPRRFTWSTAKAMNAG